MDLQSRMDRLAAMQAINEKAQKMAEEGKDAFEVRDFIKKGKEEIAFAIPDPEATQKAINATKQYIARREGRRSFEEKNVV